MRDPENIRAVEALGVQWMGFIFWPGSKRYVSERPSYLPTKCKRVGVFVDADITEILQKVEEYALDRRTQEKMRAFVEKWRREVPIEIRDPELRR